MFRGIPERRTYDLNFIQVKVSVRGSPLTPKAKAKAEKAHGDLSLLD